MVIILTDSLIELICFVLVKVYPGVSICLGYPK